VQQVGFIYKEAHRLYLTVFENWVLRGTTGPQSEEVTGNWRKSKENVTKISVLAARLLKIQDFLGRDALCILKI
jgi:hypothetical protein